MESLRINLCYRPLRIGWAIRADDFVAFRKAVRYSYALWGGRFNPILFVDDEAEFGRLVDLFRVDVIFPIGDLGEGEHLLKKYAYLINPFFHDSVFMKGNEHSEPWSNVLDIQNTLAYLRGKQEWKELKDFGLRTFTWNLDDPLADVFLSQLGAYPSQDDVGIDYLEILKTFSEITQSQLDSREPIPTTTIDHPGIPYLSRYGIERHYGIRPGWNYPGFFVGSATSLRDLVCHWNLRACDIPLWFVDPQYLERYTAILPAWEKAMQERVANYRHEWDRKVAVWTRQEDLESACKPLGELALMRCQVSDATWNGRNVQAPMMYFGETSVLGVMSTDRSKPKLSFALSDKPFCDDIWFHHQHLVVSVTVTGGLYGDEHNSFLAPYLPELNEFYARTMHFEYDKLRVEPERIGIVIDAADHDSFLYPLPVGALIKRLFEMAGYEAGLSHAGLIAKQLITRLDGIHGGKVFKIPGVRRLLKTYGPNASLTKKAALQAIGSKDPERPDAKFSDHSDLYIEPRQPGQKLTPEAVFGYLVEKGLFRIGADLSCPACNLNSWLPIDSLKHEVVCDLCGHEHDVTRHLTNVNQWTYRRSGVLGIEKNSQGAIPVVLTLQQLDATFHGFDKRMYSPSLNFVPKSNNGGNECEADFVWVIPRAYPRKTVVILAECKDQGPIDVEDINNLKRIADSLPKKRFKTFILLSKIPPFTEAEIAAAKGLNDRHRRRAILLTAKQLEPYFIGENTKHLSERKLSWYSPEEMAASTFELYFSDEKNRTRHDGGSGTAIEKNISGRKYHFDTVATFDSFQGVAMHIINGLKTTIYGSIDSDRDLAIEKTIKLIERISVKR